MYKTSRNHAWRTGPRLGCILTLHDLAFNPLHFRADKKCYIRCKQVHREFTNHNTNTSIPRNDVRRRHTGIQGPLPRLID